jgi:hypothetical protein
MPSSLGLGPGTEGTNRVHQFNALQRLIYTHVQDTGETYADIAARGRMPRQTVSALMNRPPGFPSMPHADTIKRLAVGLRLPRSVVQAAAADSVSVEHPTPTPDAVLLQRLVETLPQSDVAVLLATARALVHCARSPSD